MSDAAKPATGAARADRTDRRPDGSAVRVMVVDDEPSLAELMASVLRYEGWEVRTARDGLSAVRTGREFRPDAVVLDVDAPRPRRPGGAAPAAHELPRVCVLFLTARDFG